MRQLPDSGACIRCGRQRQINKGRPVRPLCWDCRDLDDTEISEVELAGGRWVVNGLVSRWVPDPVPASCEGCGGPDLVGCETCLVWAENNARQHADAQLSLSRRHLVWHALEHQKQLEGAA